MSNEHGEEAVPHEVARYQQERDQQAEAMNEPEPVKPGETLRV